MKSSGKVKQFMLEEKGKSKCRGRFVDNHEVREKFYSARGGNLTGGGSERELTFYCNEKACEGPLENSSDYWDLTI